MASTDSIAAARAARQSPLAAGVVSATAVLLVGSILIPAPVDFSDAVRVTLLGVAATGVLAVLLWATGGSLVEAWLAHVARPPDIAKPEEIQLALNDEMAAAPYAPAQARIMAVRAYIRTLEFCVSLSVAFAGVVLAAASAGLIVGNSYKAVVIAMVALAVVFSGALGAASAIAGLRELDLGQPRPALSFQTTLTHKSILAAAMPALVLSLLIWLAAPLPPARSSAGAFSRTMVYAAVSIGACDPIPIDALYTRPARARDPAVLAPFIGARLRSDLKAGRPLMTEMLLTPSAALEKCADLQQLMAALNGERVRDGTSQEVREPYGRMLVFLLLEALRAGLGDDEVASLWTKALGHAGDIVKDTVKSFANRAAELSAERLFDSGSDQSDKIGFIFNVPIGSHGGANAQVACRAQDPRERVLFAPNKAALSRQGQAVLDRLAERALAVDQPRFLITGHADRTGSDRFNLRLSVDRVEAVMAALARRGIAYDHMLLQAFGAAWPIEPRSSHFNDADRRVAVWLCSANRQSGNARLEGRSELRPGNGQKI